MAQRVVQRVLMTWMAVVVIAGTTSAQPPVELAIPRLRAAIKIPTISTFSGPKDPSVFSHFIFFIRENFRELYYNPLVEVVEVNEYSLLYYVPGSNRRLLPYLLSAHYDVVDASPQGWKHPPFSAHFEYDTGLIYGRGTMDDKSRLMAILENVSYRIKNLLLPKRGFYLAVGHDQEVYGYKGAKEIAKLLKRRKVQLEFILDQGMPVLDDPIIPAKKPVAIIGVAEKGYVTVQMKANGVYGHSAIPPSNTSLVKLSRAIKNIYDHPLPLRFDSGLEKPMLNALAPNFEKCFDLMMTYQDYFNPTFKMFADHQPIINALLRTTTAYTIFQSGVKMNVIPQSATVVLNHRIHPNDTVNGVFEYDQMMVNDESIEFEKLNQSEPSKISPHYHSTFGFKVIKNSIIESVENVVVAPGLHIGATDSKWYSDFSSQVYRFSPYTANVKDIDRIHGVNERISDKNYERLINFYYKLMQMADEPA